MSNKGARQHAMVCYDLETVKKIIDRRLFEHVAYIFHDKDKKKNGQIKKAHYHVLMYSQNAMTSSAVVKKIEKMLERDDPDYFDRDIHDGPRAMYVKDTGDVMDYMTHSNTTDKNKFKYDIADINGDWEWWCEHLDELRHEIAIMKEDWTIAIFDLLNDKLRMRDGTWVLCREDVSEIAKNHGRDFFLNFRRAIDSMRLILNAEIMVLSKNDIYRKFEAPNEFEKMVQEEKNNTK